MINFKGYFRLFVFLCALCAFAAGNSFAQNLENLAAQINRGNSEQKRSALAEIRNLQSETASRLALPALKDADEIVRATAALSVIFLPKDEAFAALSPLLTDKAEIVRRETAFALGKVQNPAAVNPLLQTFQKDKIPEVRSAAVAAVGEIGDVSAVGALTQILQEKPKKSDDADEFRRRTAARAIGQIAQIIQIKESHIVTPESFLPEKYKLVTLEKYENLSARFPQFGNAVSVLSSVLQNSNETDDTRREAAFALGAIGDDAALPVLQANLTAKDYYLAEICKESLKKISSRE
jgi:HEAT repeat protein